MSVRWKSEVRQRIRSTDVTDVSPMEVGRRKKEESWREDTMYKLMVFVPVLYFFFCDFSGFFSFPLSSSPLIITHFCFPILSFSSTSIRKIPYTARCRTSLQSLPSSLEPQHQSVTFVKSRRRLVAELTSSLFLNQ